MDGAEISKVGEEAMRLMEDLAEDGTVPDGATVELVGLAVTLRYPETDDEVSLTATHTRVNTRDRLHQVGLFTTAASVVIDAPDSDDG